VVVVDAAALLEPARGLGALVALDRTEWLPVDVFFSHDPVPVGLLRYRLWKGEAQLEHLGDVAIEELLSEVLVRARLDFPSQQEVLRDVRPRTEEVDDRQPPPVERVLEHLALHVAARSQLERDVLSMAEMQLLLRADPLEDAGVGRVGGLQQRGLRDERGAVDEPSDECDIAPAAHRIVEHVVELRPPVHEVRVHRIAALAEVLGDAVKEL
jgi:hypothetical protein